MSPFTVTLGIPLVAVCLAKMKQKTKANNCLHFFFQMLSLCDVRAFTNRNDLLFTVFKLALILIKGYINQSQIQVAYILFVKDTM